MVHRSITSIFRWVWTRDPLLVWNMHIKNKRNGLLGRFCIHLHIPFLGNDNIYRRSTRESPMYIRLFKEIIINRHLIGCHPTSARKRKVRNVMGSSTLLETLDRGLTAT